MFDIFFMTCLLLPIFPLSITSWVLFPFESESFIPGTCIRILFFKFMGSNPTETNVKYGYLLSRCLSEAMIISLVAKYRLKSHFKSYRLKSHFCDKDHCNIFILLNRKPNRFTSCFKSTDTFNIPIHQTL